MTAATPIHKATSSGWDSVYEWLWQDRRTNFVKPSQCHHLLRYRDGAPVFCGAPVPIGGKSYCTFHRRPG